MKKIIALAVFFLAGCMLIGRAQDNFSFSPQQPRPGDVVKIIYTPPANVFNVTDNINGIVSKWGTWCDPVPRASDRNFKPVEIILKKNGSQYEAVIPTDSFTRMLAVEFTCGTVKWTGVGADLVLASGKIDNNQNRGYCIPFYTSGGSPTRYSHFFMAKYLLSRYNNGLGIKNPENALEHLLKEQELYPDAKYYVLPHVAACYSEKETDKFKLFADKEINKLFAGGLKSEKEMRLLASLYSAERLMGQTMYFLRQLNEKFKDSGGVATISARYGDLTMEKDPANKLTILADIADRYNKADFETRRSLSLPESWYWQLLFPLSNAGKTDELKFFLEKFNYCKAGILSGNNGWFFPMILDTLVSRGKDLDLAEKFAMEHYSFSTGQLANIKKGAAVSPLTEGEYYSSSEKTHFIATDAAIAAYWLSRIYSAKEDEKMTWKYAREARQYLELTTSEYFSAFVINNQYCQLAEKYLPAKECMTQIEKMMASGSWTPAMLEVLKRVWVKENKSETGFEDFVRSLRKDAVEEVKKTLLATQLNYAAPAFSLKDLNGKEVSLQSLKGKTLVVDFWATWCGPCKASFPGMQQLVNAYKNNPDVQFLFIDTWESKYAKMDTDEKKLKAVADYINEKKYSFNVLMDNASKTVADFKVDAIPSKFIIDKEGNVRYKIVGFDSNEGRLYDEMSAMIESVK